MSCSKDYVLQKIIEKLDFDINVELDLSEKLNHRELFYLHLEICLYAKKYMPYEYINSSELIYAWLNDISIAEKINQE